MAQDLSENIRSRSTRTGVVFDVRMSIPGNPRHFKGGFATRKEAADYRDKILRAKNAAALLRQRTLRLPDLIEMWMEATDSDKVGSTRGSHETTLRLHIRPELNVPVDKVSAELLRKFLRELPARLPKHATTGRSTYKRVVDMTRASLRWAARPDVRLIEENPLRDVPIAMPAKGKARKPVESEAFLQLMEATAGKQSQLIWFMLGYTGARKGEITALLWSDIDFAGATVSIVKISTPESKGAEVEGRVKMGQERDVPLDEELLEVLRELKETRGAAAGDPIFPAPKKGGTIGFGTIDKWWLRDCKAAGIESGKDGYVIHGLRHMFTTVMIDAGVDVNTVSKMLGHSSVATTQAVYQHISTERKRKAANVMGAALRRGKK